MLENEFNGDMHSSNCVTLQGGIIVGESPAISKISKENTCGTQGIHAYGDLAKNDNIRQKLSRC